MKEKNALGGLALGLICVVLILISCATHHPQYKQAENLYMEGQELRSQGENGAAMEKFETSYTLSKETGYLAGIAHNLNELAMIHSAKGEERKARELLTEAFVLYSQEGMIDDVSKTLNNMAF